MAASASPPILSNTKIVFFYNEVLPKDILSLTFSLGCKNEKRPSGPIELKWAILFFLLLEDFPLDFIFIDNNSHYDKTR